MKFSIGILIILSFLLISGCASETINISKERHEQLLSLEQNYNILQQRYTNLDIKCNREIQSCSTQLHNVTNILHNQLDYSGPIDITFPIINIQHTFTYKEASDLAQLSFYVSLVALVLDILVLFIFQNNKNRVLKLVIIISSLALAAIFLNFLKILL